MIDYKKKYLKYKKKYLNIKVFQGGMFNNEDCPPQSGYYQQQQPYLLQQQPGYYQQQPYQQQPYQQQYCCPSLPVYNGEEGHNEEYCEEKKPSKGMEIVTPQIDTPREDNELIKINKNLQDENTNLRIQLDVCNKENSTFTEVAAFNGWDIRKNASHIPFVSLLDVQIFNHSGPFIISKKVKHLEDQMTEYKSYENIYSNYDKEENKADISKGLDFKIKGQGTSDIKEILCKNIIGFLNTQGGRLFLGINDDLIVTGINNIKTDKHRDHLQLKIIDEVYKEIMAYDTVSLQMHQVDPRNINFVWHNIIKSENIKYVLEIQIAKGSPNYIYSINGNIWFRYPGEVGKKDLPIAISIMEQRNTTIECVEAVGVEMCETP